MYCEGTHSIEGAIRFLHNESADLARRGPGCVGSGVLAARIGTRSRTRSPGSGGNICCIADSSLIELNTISGGIGHDGQRHLCEQVRRSREAQQHLGEWRLADYGDGLLRPG